MVEVLRTPDDRFSELPDFTWEPSYTQVTADDGTDLRLARIDEGEGHPVVLLHGEPTWSFLWRKVLPPLLEAGHRCIVPDQVGFGRSDKPADKGWYSYERLYTTFRDHLAQVIPDGRVTLVVHDWGGPVGLRWAAEHRDRIARVVVLDTGLYTSGSRMSEDWWAFRNFVERAETFPVDVVIQGATLTTLRPDEMAGYQAPFPSADFHASALALPLLVPTADDAPGAAEQMAAFAELASWKRPPIHLLWADKDPVIPVRVAHRLREQWPAVTDLEVVSGSHFLQEDSGPAIGEQIRRWIG